MAHLPGKKQTKTKHNAPEWPLLPSWHVIHWVRVTLDCLQSVTTDCPPAPPAAAAPPPGDGYVQAYTQAANQVQWTDARSRWISAQIDAHTPRGLTPSPSPCSLSCSSCTRPYRCTYRRSYTNLIGPLHVFLFISHHVHILLASTHRLQLDLIEIILIRFRISLSSTLYYCCSVKELLQLHFILPLTLMITRSEIQLGLIGIILVTYHT